jgi:hypothetical protein
MTSSQSGSAEEFNIYNATLNSINPTADPKNKLPLQSMTSLKQYPLSKIPDQNEQFLGKVNSSMKLLEEDKLFHSKPEIRLPLAANEINISKGNSSGNIRNSRTSESHRSSKGGPHSIKNKENIGKMGLQEGGSRSSVNSGSQGKSRGNFFFNGIPDAVQGERRETNEREGNVEEEYLSKRRGGNNAQDYWVGQPKSEAEGRRDIGKISLQLNGISNPSGHTSFLLTNSKSKFETKSRDLPESGLKYEIPIPKKTSQYYKAFDLAGKNNEFIQRVRSDPVDDKLQEDLTKQDRDHDKKDIWKLSFEKINEMEEENVQVSKEQRKKYNIKLNQLLNMDEGSTQKESRGMQSSKRRNMGQSDNKVKECDAYDLQEPQMPSDYLFFEEEIRQRHPYKKDMDMYLPHRRHFPKDKYMRFEGYRDQSGFDYDDMIGPKREKSKEYYDMKKLHLEKLSPLRFESRMRRDARYYKNRSRYEDFYDKEFDDPSGYRYNNPRYMKELKKSQMMDHYWYQKQKELNNKIQIYEEKLREMGYDMYQKRRSDGDRRDRTLIRKIYENMPNSHQVSANPSPKILPSTLEKWKMKQGKSMYAPEESSLGKRKEPEFLFPRKEVEKKRKKKSKWEEEDEEWNFEEEIQKRKRRGPRRNNNNSQHMRELHRKDVEPRKNEEHLRENLSHPQSETKVKHSSNSSRDQGPMTEHKKTKRKRIRRRKPLVFKDNNPNQVVGVSCKCKKSRCLKLYCECFSNDGFCHPSCKCENCCNKEEFKELKELVRKEILQKNPKAFQKKFKKVKKKEGFLHSRGCNCKKTECLKNYCECFSVGIGCSTLCKCINCKNKKLDIAPKEAQKYFEKPERKRRKPTLLYEYILDQIKDKDTPDLQNKVELAITNDYERILDEIKNNYDPRKLKKHIKKVSEDISEVSEDPKKKLQEYSKNESNWQSEYSERNSLEKPEDFNRMQKNDGWVEHKDVIVDEDDDEDDLANTMEKFKKLRQE